MLKIWIQIVVQTKTKSAHSNSSIFEAEYFDAESGTQTVITTDETGTDQVGDIQNGDWIMFKALDITDAYSLDLRVASTSNNAKIELRLDALDGQLF